MRVLLDTCVISELGRQQGNARVRASIERLDDADLFLSVINLGEITKGIALLPASARKSALQAWLRTLERDYADRILPIDAEVARLRGELTANAQSRGRTIAATDGLIAATAIHDGLHIMTRNVGDFSDTGAMLVNPWEDL